jgi:hypothetical protein
MECINATSLRRKSGQWGTQPSLPVTQVNELYRVKSVIKKNLLYRHLSACRLIALFALIALFFWGNFSVRRRRAPY